MERMSNQQRSGKSRARGNDNGHKRGDNGGGGKRRKKRETAPYHLQQQRERKKQFYANAKRIQQYKKLRAREEKVTVRANFSGIEQRVGEGDGGWSDDDNAQGEANVTQQVHANRPQKSFYDRVFQGEVEVGNGDSVDVPLYKPRFSKSASHEVDNAGEDQNENGGVRDIYMSRRKRNRQRMEREARQRDEGLEEENDTGGNRSGMNIARAHANAAGPRGECFNFKQNGTCKFGDRCRFKHGKDDVRFAGEEGKGSAKPKRLKANMLDRRPDPLRKAKQQREDRLRAKHLEKKDFEKRKKVERGKNIERKRKFQKFSRRTSRGQPIMKHRIDSLLDKIKSQTQ